MAKRHYLGEMADPATKECDWCGGESTASYGYEIFRPGKKIGTAQFLYCCPRHQAVCKRTIDGLRERKKAA